MTRTRVLGFVAVLAFAIISTACGDDDGVTRETAVAGFNSACADYFTAIGQLYAGSNQAELSSQREVLPRGIELNRSLIRDLRAQEVPAEDREQVDAVIASLVRAHEKVPAALEAAKANDQAGFDRIMGEYDQLIISAVGKVIEYGADGCNPPEAR